MDDNSSVQTVYVLTFASDAVKDKFIGDNHFQTVPVRLLSTLPKPAPTASSRVRVAKTPFDPSKHFEQRPHNSLVAAYFDGHADFDALERWARSVTFDKAGWPDFKRFYKHIELRVWLLATRSRWKKNESDLPFDSPVPGERELIALGLLIGRLAETNERDGRNRRRPVPADGPTRVTLAYMLRRAERLIGFLRDKTDLSAPRRAWLAPLVAGMLQRPSGLVFATQHNLIERDELAARPDLIEQLWQDTTLPVVVLKWAHDWLRARSIEVRATPAHIQVLLASPEGFELALGLLPPLSGSGAARPADYSLADVSRALELVGVDTAYLPRVLSLFARFAALQPDDEWVRAALGEVGDADPEAFDWATRWIQKRVANGDFALVSRLSAPLQRVFNSALIALFPNGLGVDTWRILVDPLSAVSPSMVAGALEQLPLSAEGAGIIWSLPPSEAGAWVDILGQNRFIEAFRETIELRAREEDLAFAASLSGFNSLQNEFYSALSRAFPDGLGVDSWRELAASPDAFGSGLTQLPLGEGFWAFFLGLPVEERSPWLERVGAPRAAQSFAWRPAEEVAALLDGDTQDLEALIDAWIDANLSGLAGGEEVVLCLATSDNITWQEEALAHLSRHPLSIPIALGLFESGLPRAQTLARQFFAEDASDWSERVLALCDSPLREARHDGLELLACFPARWTPELLTRLAEHDDPLVQSFVAARLARAPQNGAVAAFENAVLNARGRSRRAKNQVQRQLNQAPQLDAAHLESLLDAARSGAPRDRAWALQQLVRLKMAGADIGELQLAGAVARTNPH